jgi:hypothetical protein
MNRLETSVINVREADKLVSVFGEWPSFHDAEVLRCEMERDGPSIVLHVFVFRTNHETDAKGYFKRTHMCLVVLRFCGVDDVVLEGFNHQNVVAAINFEKQGSSRLVVNIEPLHGIGGKFSCKFAEVVQVSRM